MEKPKLSSGQARKEVDRLETEFQEKAKQMSSMTQDEIATAPVKETESKVEMSKKEIIQFDAPMIKPSHKIHGIGKPKAEQEGLRKKAWEYVKVVAENLEVHGETIEFWHKPPYSGEPCCFWQVPVNKPVYVPRFVADHLSTRCYHRLVMQEKTTNLGHGEITSTLVATETRRRLDCRTVGFS